MTELTVSKVPFEDLLTRTRSGDSLAREELLRRCMERASRLVKEPKRKAMVEKIGARPSDISQDSLLKVFQHIDRFKGDTEGEFWGWLTRIVKNEATQTYRHSTRQQRDVMDTVPLDSKDALAVKARGPSPSQVTAHQEEWRRVLAAFSWLAEQQPDQHQALSMFYLDELPVKAIAESLGKTQKSVEGLMQRGSRALRSYMTEEPDEDGPLTPEVAAMRNEADAAYCRYLRRREAGEKVDVEAFVAKHPSCAEELRGMLQWMPRLRALDPSRNS
ncbi:ECF family RNA polymerase sigma factor [Myxococcus stipitatus DSM 14675]|uniref:ECF family RNA polymerase sigma factor n=1 Tax=Myxococcus stipitatus (strain DSM 14675 / JCM 12634 / Mx s8) TaxID=1278073 RepID=L7URH8_MYXSD|nr:sigma-70 family RNA polymerase sigma factor [Myxococcus stipitatus]AGC49219.1 ECF family RNA polymerase sigma factor [Myxococcus stipitatus DSM 14675]